MGTKNMAWFEWNGTKWCLDRDAILTARMDENSITFDLMFGAVSVVVIGEGWDDEMRDMLLSFFIDDGESSNFLQFLNFDMNLGAFTQEMLEESGGSLDELLEIERQKYEEGECCSEECGCQAKTPAKKKLTWEEAKQLAWECWWEKGVEFLDTDDWNVLTTVHDGEYAEFEEFWEDLKQQLEDEGYGE